MVQSVTGTVPVSRPILRSSRVFHVVRSLSVVIQTLLTGMIIYCQDTELRVMKLKYPRTAIWITTMYLTAKSARGIYSLK